MDLWAKFVAHSGFGVGHSLCVYIRIYIYIHMYISLSLSLSLFISPSLSSSLPLLGDRRSYAGLPPPLPAESSEAVAIFRGHGSIEGNPVKLNHIRPKP